jgi:hypothetical protein
MSGRRILPASYACQIYIDADEAPARMIASNAIPREQRAI